MAGVDGRDNASVTALNNLTLIENIILNVIKKGMADGKHYKEIYRDSKSAVIHFKEVAYLTA